MLGRTASTSGVRVGAPSGGGAAATGRRLWSEAVKRFAGSRVLLVGFIGAVALLVISYMLELAFFEGASFLDPGAQCAARFKAPDTSVPDLGTSAAGPGGGGGGGGGAERLSERMLCSTRDHVACSGGAKEHGCVRVGPSGEGGVWMVRGMPNGAGRQAGQHRERGAVTAFVVVSADAGKGGADSDWMVPTDSASVEILAGLLGTAKVAQVCLLGFGGETDAVERQAAQRLRALHAAVAASGTEYVLVVDTLWALRERHYRAELLADISGAPAHGPVLGSLRVADLMDTIEGGKFGLVGSLTAMDDGSRRLYRSCYALDEVRTGLWSLRAYRLGFSAAHHGGWVCDTTSPTFVASVDALLAVVDDAAATAAKAAPGSAPQFDDGCWGVSAPGGLCGAGDRVTAERRLERESSLLLWQRALFPRILLSAKQLGVRVGVNPNSMVFEPQAFLLGRLLDRRVGLHELDANSNVASLDPSQLEAGVVDASVLVEQPLPPCCCVSVRLRSLLGLFNDFMRVRLEHNVAHPDIPLRVLASEGTLHGVAKISDALPWDVDIDFLVFTGREDPNWLTFIKRWTDYGFGLLYDGVNTAVHYELWPKGVQDGVFASQMDIGHLKIDMREEDANWFILHKFLNPDALRYMRYRRLVVEVPADVGAFMTKENGPSWYTHRCDPDADNDSCTLQRRIVDYSRFVAVAAVVLIVGAVTWLRRRRADRWRG